MTPGARLLLMIAAVASLSFHYVSDIVLHGIEDLIFNFPNSLVHVLQVGL